MSIYNKIRIIFLISAIFTTAFFGAFVYIYKNDQIMQMKNRYVQTTFYINRHLRQNRNKEIKTALRDPNLKQFLSESGFAIVKKPKQINRQLKDGSIVFKRKVRRSKLKIIRLKNSMFLSIKNKNFLVILRDKHPHLFPWGILFWYMLALGLLGGLYVWLTKSLKPLRVLEQQIQKVANGDLGVSIKSDRNDEIARVANAFDDALRKLESLINSRQLFLRSIMHELKTPIAKGRLLNEFLEDSKHKDGYDVIFERLELLIGEFSKIEQMLSSSYEVRISQYSALDIIEQALELMILDDEQMQEKVSLVQKSDYTVHADFELLALAIKNLIDNAIKYSIDKKVEIIINHEGIYIVSIGSRFTDSLEPYLEPFHDKKHGLGLGLYIVQNIIKMLPLKLDYKHRERKNIFLISNRQATTYP